MTDDVYAAQPGMQEDGMCWAAVVAAVQQAAVPSLTCCCAVLCCAALFAAGNFLDSSQAAAFLEAARDKLIRAQQEGGSSSSKEDGVVLTAALQMELLQMAMSAQRMLRGVMDDIPLPVGCNNPGCTRLEAMAEATLSINKRCSQCLAAHYCCKECQVQHWPAHKLACKRLRPQVPSKAAAV
jgi:hypothetical protein